MVGDEIVSVENTTVWTTFDIQYKMQNNGGRTDENGNLLLDFKVKRGGELIALKDVQFKVETDDNGNSDVIYSFYVQPLERNFLTVIEYSGRETASISRMIMFTLADLFKGKYGLKDLSGPVGTVTVVSQSVSYGLPSFCYLFAFITINVGVFNLLPIPALDGCKLLFLAWEGLTGHPVPLRAQSFINTAGMVALLWLMILVTMQDITRFL